MDYLIRFGQAQAGFIWLLFSSWRHIPQALLSMDLFLSMTHRWIHWIHLDPPFLEPLSIGGEQGPDGSDSETNRRTLSQLLSICEWSKYYLINAVQIIPIWVSYYVSAKSQLNLS